MDEVPIPLRQLVSSPYPSDEEVFSAISARLEPLSERMPGNKYS